MRSFVWGLSVSVVLASSASAQLLEKPPAKPPAGADAKDAADKKAANQNVPTNNGAAGAPAAAAQTNAMFSAIDTDGDGVISKVELRKAIKGLKTLDADNDGAITLAEASVGGGAVAAGNVGVDPRVAQLMTADANRDGKLTPNEVPQNMIPMLQGVDRNGDRAIDQNELAAAFANAANQFGGVPAGRWPGAGGNPDQQATGQFLQYDRNGDGKLTQEELPPQAGRLLKDADTDGNGSIDAGELQAAIAQMGDRARALRGGVDPGAPRGRGVADRDRKRPGDGN